MFYYKKFWMRYGLGCNKDEVLITVQPQVVPNASIEDLGNKITNECTLVVIELL